jgi:hypothetical protein
MRHVSTMVVGTLLLLFAAVGQAQNGKIITQKLNSSGEGITVMRVWGTHHEMGYAQGKLMAQDIIKGGNEMKALAGALYGALRQQIQATVWKPSELEQELGGLVAGVKAAVPSATIDKLDLKVVNTYGDWGNPMACRSHSAWGSFVKGPTKTLSTRRLDYGLPKSVTLVKHHVLLARQPSDGSVRWVNLAWPGFVTSVTGVNEYGTLASLHDYKSKFKLGAHMPRHVAVRYALTLVKGLDLAQHLDTVFTELKKSTMMTSTFINYYVPQGHGGVLTCMAGMTCSKKRTPQPDFHKGLVLVTANTETDGKTTPSDDSFMDGYYTKGGTKALADHYGLMGHTGMHLLSLDYRGREDMTIWVEGRLSKGVTQTEKLEWKDLFSNAAPQVDGGGGPSDGGPFDGSSSVDAMGDFMTAADGDDGGCVVSGEISGTSLASIGILALVLVIIRIRCWSASTRSGPSARARR